jgi:hypothetical protein
MVSNKTLAAEFRRQRKFITIQQLFDALEIYRIAENVRAAYIKPGIQEPGGKGIH